MNETQIENMGDLQRLVRSGYSDWGLLGDVSVKEKDGLLLFNYAVPAVLANRWNYFERVSRGLILDARTGEIVARPLEKFFNWLENGRKTDAPLKSITEKVDGSLIIGFARDGEWMFTTRGSFDSDQALWAKEFFARMRKRPLPPINMTYLFEGIYPGNRVVVDYGDQEALVLLAMRRNTDGVYYPLYRQFAQSFEFALPVEYTFETPQEIVDFLPTLDANREGFVAEFADGQRFKFKGDAYKQLHKLISGLSYARAIEAVQTENVATVRELIPDEFLAEWNGWVKEIEIKVDYLRSDVELAFLQAPKSDRKTFALWVQENAPHLAPYLFARLDNRDYLPILFRKEF